MDSTPTIVMSLTNCNLQHGLIKHSERVISTGNGEPNLKNAWQPWQDHCFSIRLFVNSLNFEMHFYVKTLTFKILKFCQIAVQVSDLCEWSLYCNVMWAEKSED